MFRPLRILLWSLACAGLFALPAAGQSIVFEHPFTGTGVISSAWLEPDGSDSDMYCYDEFMVPVTTAVTEVRWRGGYAYGGIYGRVWNFRITFYASTANGSQPACGNPQLPETFLADYDVGGVAGETPIGTYGGIAMYQYGDVLPTAFVAVANTKYWIRIEASQVGYPDWGIAKGTGGDGQHFVFSTGAARFSFATADAAFQLLGSGATTYVISTSESPAGTGTTTGAGPYPDGAAAVVNAVPNPGYAFVNWTEGATVVSTNPTYTFTVHADRNLVANFAPAITVSTSPAPVYGGTTGGNGSWLVGGDATVTATPNAGFRFVHWTEYGAEVSTSATYTFLAEFDRVLAANFAPDIAGALFDFDTAWPPLGIGQGIPVAQTASGITATFDSPDGSVFSLQSDGNLFYRMSLFSGLYLYPNNLNRNTLRMQFDHLLKGIYFAFATADNHQNEVPTTMQLTAYDNASPGTPVGTATAHGTYGSDTFPMGTMSFNSAAPFDRVELVLPYQPLGVGAFFVDNITASLASLVDAGPAAGVAPAVTRLLGAAPNPLRDGTTVAFELAAAGSVRLAVYDVAGRPVRDLVAATLQSGRQVARWDGRAGDGARVAAGVYFVKLEAAGATAQSRKVIVLP